MAITLFGIKNCDSVRKARKHLADADVPYSFKDFKAEGIDDTQFNHWLDHVPVETLINRRGTSWRALADSDKSNLTASNARVLAHANPSLVKRPVVDWGDTVTVGYNLEEWQRRIEALR